MIKKYHQGVGVPIGLEHTRSNPGQNRTVLPSDFTDVDKPSFSHKDYSIRNIDLSVARNAELLNIAGTFLWIPNGSSAVATLSVALDSAGNDDIPLLPGSHISGLAFSRLYLTNTAQASESVSLFIATDFPNDRLDIK